MAIEDLDLEFEDENESEKENTDALDVDVDLSFSAHEDEGNAVPEPTPTSQINPDATVEINLNDIPQQQTTKQSNIAADDVTDPNLRVPEELSKSPTPKDSPAPREIQKQTAPKKDASSEQNVSNINEARKKATEAAKAKASTKPVAQAKPTSQVVNAPSAQASSTPQAAPIGSAPNQQVAAVNDVLLKELTYYREQVERLRTDMDSMKEELFNAKKESEIKIAVAQMKAEMSIELLSNGQLMEQKVNQMLQRIVKKVPQLKGEAVTIKKAIAQYMEVVKKQK